jgi:hypothetical protein
MLLALALVAGTPLTPENFPDVRDISISCYLRASLSHLILPENPKPTTSGKLVLIYLPEAIMVKALRSARRTRTKLLKSALIMDPDNALGWKDIYRLQLHSEVPAVQIWPSPGPEWKNSFSLMFEKSAGWVGLARPISIEKGYELTREDGPGLAGLGCSVTSGRAAWAL